MGKQRCYCIHEASRRHVDIELSSWSRNLYSGLGLYLTVKSSEVLLFLVKLPSHRHLVAFFFLYTKASHLCKIIHCGRECFCLTLKMHRAAGCAKHVLNYCCLSCLGILRKMRKVRWKQFAGALSAKFLDMWDLLCLKVYYSILSEEGNKDFKPKWNQIHHASLPQECESTKLTAEGCH